VISIGAAVAFVGCLLPWVSVVFLGSLNLFNALNVRDSNGIWAGIVLAACASLFFIGLAMRGRPTKDLAIAALVIAIAAGGLTALWGIGLEADVQGASGFADLGAGPFVTVGGFVIAAIAAGRLTRTSRLT
jgi:hypothetical protein